MFILYLLLSAYILSVNFYAFLLVKTLRDQEKEKDPSFSNDLQGQNAQRSQAPSIGRLYLTGLLGGAVTVYVCMFLFRYKRNDQLLMIFMPVLGVLNIYLFVLLFRSGLGVWLVR